MTTIDDDVCRFGRTVRTSMKVHLPAGVRLAGVVRYEAAVDPYVVLSIDGAQASIDIVIRNSAVLEDLVTIVTQVHQELDAALQYGDDFVGGAS